MKTSKKHLTCGKWTPALRRLKALSIRQPFAWLVVNGWKDIENRKWSTKVRGPVLIHAGSARPPAEHLQAFLDAWPQAKLDYGGIAGVVDMVDCVEKHPSEWFRGPVGWVLANARPLPFKPCPGKLKFFTPDI